MEKILLVDGNNLLFRSYYATAYNGNFMRNSKGFPTNAIFGFVSMINKIIAEENPTYMMVAFDKGKTFRHDKYPTYKEGRIETPDELLKQFPIAKDILTKMGIKYYEIDNYEADDIIGTFARYCNEDPNFVGTIISSDRDLLQLISDDIDIKLLKSKDYIRYNKETFKADYGIDPINIIDLKALEGDSSDNIPGVRGIGEKTALKMLQDYKTLDGVYQNIDKFSPKMQEKLLADKDNAYMSYDLATIETHAPLEINISDTKYMGPDYDSLNALYEELEFYSFLKKAPQPTIKKSDNAKILTNFDNLNLKDKCSIYLEILGTNYHTGKILGLAYYDDDNSFFVPSEYLKRFLPLLNDKEKYTYDLKKMYVALKWKNLSIDNVVFDTMLAAYLLDYNIKDDIAVLANTFNYEIPFYDVVFGKTKLIEPDIQTVAANAVMKAQFIYDTYNEFKNKLESEELIDLFNNIEMPLTYVLGDMEYSGVNIDRNTLVEMGKEINIKIELVSQTIYNHAGEEFNISSPKQLGEILFEKLGLKHGKKGATGYSTSADVLEKLKGKHPIIDDILEYRMLTKLYSTYIEGLMATIMPDNKIHTIYNQALTRTGRLSSVEPNLQNIPIRYEYGRLIRKAFIPSPNSVILSGDYSQIELRILAHMADVPALIEAFKENKDIHTKTASDIFKVPESLVTKDMRRMAKAVNFGIIYGISGYGLSENLGIAPSEASRFIKDYLDMYPGIKNYMDNVIKDAHEKGYVRTLFNRKRNIPELNNKNYMIRSGGERMALNTPIQGTSADIIKLAMIKIHKKLKEENLQSKMILQVHDELIFDCLESEREQVTKIVEDIMNNVCELKVPLKVDMEYGYNWYDAK